MKTLIATLLFISSTSIAAQPSYELSCRAQAKEIAAQTYKTCLTDNRNAELEQIKLDYQAKLNALKEQYQSDLKKLAKAKSAPAPKAEMSTVAAESEAAPATSTKASTLPDESEMDLPEPIPAT